MSGVVSVQNQSFVVVTAPGPQGPPGSGGGGGLTGELVGDELIVTVTSNWGIDSDGNPYYDPNGAADGEDAVASLDADGNLLLTKPAGA